MQNCRTIRKNTELQWGKEVLNVHGFVCAIFSSLHRKGEDNDRELVTRCHLMCVYIINWRQLRGGETTLGKEKVNFWCFCFNRDTERILSIDWTFGERSVNAKFVLIVALNLLSTSLQFLTFVFQSHVWRSISKARPPGQRTFAKRLMLFKFSPELSHLTF